jgi:hypothetical protein
MQQTTEGRFRVLASTRDRDEWLLLDVDSGDPTYVPRGGYEDALADAVAGLEPGNRVRATIEWDDGPRFAALAVESRTEFHFARTREQLYEPARECWSDAQAAGEAMNATVTYGTDGEPNGVTYVFAKQPGQRDLYEEFEDGGKPLDPLLARLAESEAPPFAVFVLDPVEREFVVVALAIDPEGVFARTLADTYLDSGLGAYLSD